MKKPEHFRRWLAFGQIADEWALESALTREELLEFLIAAVWRGEFENKLGRTTLHIPCPHYVQEFKCTAGCDDGSLRNALARIEFDVGGIGPKAKRYTESMGGQWHGEYGTANCPAHDDDAQSLAIRDRYVAVDIFNRRDLLGGTRHLQTKLNIPDNAYIPFGGPEEASPWVEVRDAVPWADLAALGLKDYEDHFVEGCWEELRVARGAFLRWCRKHHLDPPSSWIEDEDSRYRSPVTHTGMPGRPSAKHLYLAELKRRHEIEDEQLAPTLKQQAKELLAWMKVKHKDLNPGTVGTVENNIRGDYRSMTSETTDTT